MSPHLCAVSGLCRVCSSSRYRNLVAGQGAPTRVSNPSWGLSLWERLCSPGKASCRDGRGCRSRAGGTAPTTGGQAVHGRWTLGAVSGVKLTAICLGQHGAPVTAQTRNKTGTRCQKDKQGCRGARPVLGGLWPFHSQRSRAAADVCHPTFTSVSSHPFLNSAPNGALVSPVHLPSGQGRWCP